MFKFIVLISDEASNATFQPHNKKETKIFLPTFKKKNGFFSSFLVTQCRRVPTMHDKVWRRNGLTFSIVSNMAAWYFPIEEEE